MWRTLLAFFMICVVARLTTCFITQHTGKIMSVRRSPLGIVHTFSGLGLDRSRVETELKEAPAFDSALKSDGAGTCVCFVLKEEGGGG